MTSAPRPFPICLCSCVSCTMFLEDGEGLGTRPVGTCACVQSCTVSTIMQDGLSPLYVASREGHSEVVDILLEGGANPNLACTV